MHMKAQLNVFALIKIQHTCTVVHVHVAYNVPYIGYISTNENLRVLDIRRFKISDTQPRVILPCIL